MKSQIKITGLVLALTLILSGCATNTVKDSLKDTVKEIKDTTSQTLTKISVKTNIGDNPRDPLEGFNRVMFNFNDAIDQAVLKPTAKAYRAVLPSFVQTGISNFFGNIGDVWTAVNDLLQGKVAEGVTDVMRVAVNTTFGLGGVIDIGSAAGMQKHREDFGQTLGTWGVKSGSYLVLPLLGPSTLRDAVATPVDYKGDLWSYVTPVKDRNIGTVVRLVDKRASVLDAGALLEEASLDRYVFLRDAYLQRRAGQIKAEDD